MLDEFPAPPYQSYQHLLDMDFVSLVNMPKHNKRKAPEWWWQRSIMRGEISTRSAHQENINLGETFDRWAWQTFAKDQDPKEWFLDQGLNVVVGHHTHTPHTDGRRWHLFWVLTEGGPECTTNFWIENNHAVQRPAYTAPRDYADLTLLDKVRMPKGKWILFNSRILHSVENCTEPRLTVQISMKSLPLGWQQKFLPGSLDDIDF